MRSAGRAVLAALRTRYSEGTLTTPGGTAHGWSEVGERWTGGQRLTGVRCVCVGDHEEPLGPNEHDFVGM